MPSIFPEFNVDVPMPAGTKHPAPSPTICDNCEHFFDPTDKRAFLHGPYAECPLCATLNHRSTTAWAVWNGCNGVFEDRVTREEAEKLLREEYDGVGTCVVPVVVVMAPDDLRHRFRDGFLTVAERESAWQRDCESRG
jgi:hypothetical protein